MLLFYSRSVFLIYQLTHIELSSGWNVALTELNQKRMGRFANTVELLEAYNVILLGFSEKVVHDYWRSCRDRCLSRVVWQNRLKI